MARIGNRRAPWVFIVVVLMTVAVFAVAGKKGDKQEPSGKTVTPEELKVVDCLLPGQVRKLGRQQVYMTQRRPIRTTALNCEIRGGEYVAYDRANYQTALEVWLASAEGGDSEAQYYVGEIYEKGLGTEPDYVKAAAWYTKAAEKGEPRAQINLGFLYEKGLGVEQDPHQAMEWYRKASGVEGMIVLESEMQAIRRELSDARERLQQSEQRTHELESELAARRDELEAERGSSQRSAERVAELEATVTSLSRAVAAEREKTAELQEARQKYALDGPRIEVFDPVAVRGTTSSSGEDLGLLAGRVDAPAGLASFQVNGEETAVDKEYFFEVRVKGDESVEFVAVDLQGLRGQLFYRRSDAATVQSEGESKPPKKSERRKYGSYYALVIGNGEYEYLPNLETATNDAAAVAKLLDEQYGFDVTLLSNVSYLDLLTAFSEMRDRLDEDDNLLIYYAGHGELDAQTGLGYWLPVEADPDRQRNWMSSREISDQLSLFPARHVLVIADSCYSGALTQSSVPRLSGEPQQVERQRRDLAQRRSRTGLTSGGLKPILEIQGGEYSIFARAILEVLSDNPEILDARRLWQKVRARVVWQTRKLPQEQVPQYAPIQYAGHESGEFFFIPVAG